MIEKKYFIRQVAICLIGSFIYASGICVLTRASLGISPISSVAYVASLIWGFSLGVCTMGFNAILILVQKMVFRKGFSIKDILLQIGISIIFSVFIDLSIYLFGWFVPQTYIGRMIYLIFGCAVMAAGMSAVVIVNITVLPGEGAIKCIVRYTGWEFGVAKILFDSSIIAIAVVICFITVGKLEGIREGTFIAALIIGTFSRFIMRHFKLYLDRFLNRWPEKNPAFDDRAQLITDN